MRYPLNDRLISLCTTSFSLEASDLTGRTKCPIFKNNWLNDGLTRWNLNSHSLECLIFVYTYKMVRIFLVIRERILRKSMIFYQLFKTRGKSIIFQRFKRRHGAAPFFNVTVACNLKITLLIRRFRADFQNAKIRRSKSKISFLIVFFSSASSAYMKKTTC